MENSVGPSNTAPQQRSSQGLPAWVIVLAFAVLVGFLALIAWGLNRTNQPPIKIGDRVPSFTLTTFDDQQIQFDDLRGKVVVINFWASWCKPCEQEAAEMQAVWQKNQAGGQVVFLGIDWVDTEPEAMAYLKKFQITYPNGPDLRTTISQIFRITGVPETYFIGKDGRLADFKSGPFTTEAELQAIINRLK